MKILDQSLQLSAHYAARSENVERRRHESYVDGLLTSRTTLEQRSVQERSSSIQLQWQGESVATKKGSPKNPVLPSALQQTHQMQSEPFGRQQRSAFSPDTLTIASDPSPKPKNKLSPELVRMIEAIESLMEKMTGKPYHLKVYGYEPDTQTTDTGKPLAALKVSSGENTPSTRPNTTPLMGERWSVERFFREQEQSQFQARGHVLTADGETIDFNLNLQMNRQFHTQNQQFREAGFVLKDPLVVNFGGTPASLTLEKTAFDIDADGQKEAVSFLQSGSGFLALDRDGDGIINNGSELFGTRSGNGFADLAAYDNDGNGWIDENDAVFAKLQVWHRDAHGLDRLEGLLELNIGAIALQNTDTPFSHKDLQNRLQGQVVSSGIFLYEDGHGAGTVQQIDLAV